MALVVIFPSRIRDSPIRTNVQLGEMETCIGATLMRHVPSGVTVIQVHWFWTYYSLLLAYYSLLSFRRRDQDFLIHLFQV